MSPLAPTYPATPRLSATTIAVIVAVHAGALALLASLDVLPLPTPLSILSVHLVAATPAAEVSPPGATPPAPARRIENQPQVRPKPAPATPPSHQLAALSDAPSASEAATATKNESAPTSTASVTSANTSTSVTTPRFDAAYLSNPAPAYPPLSRKLREEGRVVLRVLVDANGRASRIEINSSSAWPRLDQAAQDAVARWKFVPARRGDDAVDAWVLVPIVFNLRS